MRGHQTISAADVADMLEAAGKGIRERGQADVGQRTLLDALVPSAEAAHRASVEGTTATVALARAAEAAAHGADATAEMQPQVGRAGWLAERARGHRDGGAVAWSILLAGLADSHHHANHSQPHQ
jgi:dihydroxyacetone kinase